MAAKKKAAPRKPGKFKVAKTPDGLAIKRKPTKAELDAKRQAALAAKKAALKKALTAKPKGGQNARIYKPSFARQASVVCQRMGATTEDLADLFGVSISCLKCWIMRYPEFAEAVALGKAHYDSLIEDRLAQRAMGFVHDEVDIRVVDHVVVQTPIRKFYPPDTEAAKFWLTNRQGDRWKNKQHHAVGGDAGNPAPLALRIRGILDEINGAGTGPTED